MKCIECEEEIPPQYKDGQWVVTGYGCGECGQQPICEDCIEGGFCDGEQGDSNQYEFPAEL